MSIIWGTHHLPYSRFNPSPKQIQDLHQALEEDLCKERTDKETDENIREMAYTTLRCMSTLQQILAHQKKRARLNAKH